MEEVARLGLNTSVDRYFYPREAAQAITSRICDTLTVDSKILRAELEEDIVYRCDVLADSLAGLRRDGLDDHQLNKFIVDAQDWAANRGDETLLRLQAEHKALRDQSMENGTFDPATLEAMKEPEQQQWNHLFGPGQQVIARVDLQSHVRIRKDAERLRAWSGGEVGLLAKYQELDSALELLENAVYFMLWQWDRRIWAEENRMRGK
jgi:hypothetical protein